MRCIRAHIFSRASSLYVIRVVQKAQLSTQYEYTLVFPNSLTSPPESVGHNGGSSDEVDGGPEAANG